MKRMYRAVLPGAVLLLFLTGTTYAAGQWYWYDMIVPKWGGSNTTNNEMKRFAGQAAISSNKVGADKTLWMRLEFVDNSAASEWHIITTGTKIRYNTAAKPGEVVHTKLQSHWNEGVNVQANGHWSPDSP